MKATMELRVRVRGVAADVGVQDAPLVRSADGRSVAVVLPIDEWLMPHGNLLTVAASPLDAATEPALLEVSVNESGSNVPLCRIAWRLAPGTEFEPFRSVVPFSVLRVPDTRVWSDAQPSPDLDGADLDEARAAAMQLFEAFARRDLTGVLRELEYRLAEFSTAYEMAYETHRNVVAEEIEEMIAADDYALVPVDPSTLQLKPCAEGRIFHVRRSDGRELVLVQETERVYEQSMAVYVARVGDTWRVVR